jgi:hypothetical protein
VIAKAHAVEVPRSIIFVCGIVAILDPTQPLALASSSG